MAPEISIIIPAYNAGKYIRKTISSCLTQRDFTKNLEVVVVDDGSVDNTADIIKEFPVTYIYQENGGPAKARNTGWNNSHTEIIFFTDSDCVPQDNWISTMCSSFRKGAHVVAGSYALKDRPSLLEKCIHYEIFYRHRQMPTFTKAFGSYNFAIMKKILQEIGGFNENYRRASGEDNDLAYRIIKAGYKIYFEKGAKVIHNHDESFFDYMKSQFLHGFWRMKLYNDFPEFISGDDYTQWKDIIEPPLAVIVIFSLFFCSHSRIFSIFIAALIFLFIIQLILPFKIYAKEKKLQFFCLAGITFCRSFARAFGMVIGVIKFNPPSRNSPPVRVGDG